MNTLETAGWLTWATAVFVGRAIVAILNAAFGDPDPQAPKPAIGGPGSSRTTTEARSGANGVSGHRKRPV